MNVRNTKLETELTTPYVVLQGKLLNIVKSPLVQPLVEAFDLFPLDVHFDHCDVSVPVSVCHDEIPQCSVSHGVHMSNSDLVKLEGNLAF